MKPKAYRETFERLAFECAIMEHPGDDTAAKAYQDWLEENGMTNLGARRVALALVRTANENAQCLRVRTMMESDPKMEKQIRALILRRCNTTFDTEPRIIIGCGGFAPIWTKSGGYWRAGTGPDSPEVAPALAAVLGSNYLSRLEQISVGAAWVLNILEPPSKRPRQ